MNLNDIDLHRLNEELQVKIISTSGVIRVEDQFGYSFRPYYGIENIKFADGTILDKDQIRELALVRGTDGSDIINDNSSSSKKLAALRFTDLNPNDILLTKSGKDMFIEIVG